MPKVTSKIIGKNGPDIGSMGLGTWAMGGPFFAGDNWVMPKGSPLGYGPTDDTASIRAVHCAIACGAKLIDTSDAYGAGHCEMLLGQALKGKRDQVFIATKFGNVHNAKTKELVGLDASPEYIREACDASLRRLQTDVIDLYQLHIGGWPKEKAEYVAETLEELQKSGKIRYFGWSTDDPKRAVNFGGFPHAAAVQFDMNIFQPAQEMLDVCHQNNFAALIRRPLAMGFLSGKFTASSVLSKEDIRSNPDDAVNHFLQGGAANPIWVQRLNAVRDILTSNGRTLVQGALAWIWAQSECAVPIPGVRNEKQARENFGAIEFGPLTPGQISEIGNILRHS